MLDFGDHNTKCYTIRFGYKVDGLWHCLSLLIKVTCLKNIPLNGIQDQSCEDVISRVWAVTIGLDNIVVVSTMEEGFGVMESILILIILLCLC